MRSTLDFENTSSTSATGKQLSEMSLKMEPTELMASDTSALLVLSMQLVSTVSNGAQPVTNEPQRFTMCLSQRTGYHLSWLPRTCK